MTKRVSFGTFLEDKLYVSRSKLYLGFNEKSEKENEVMTRLSLIIFTEV